MADLLGNFQLEKGPIPPSAVEYFGDHPWKRSCRAGLRLVGEHSIA